MLQSLPSIWSMISNRIREFFFLIQNIIKKFGTDMVGQVEPICTVTAEDEPEPYSQMNPNHTRKSSGRQRQRRTRKSARRNLWINVPMFQFFLRTTHFVSVWFNDCGSLPSDCRYRSPVGHRIKVNEENELIGHNLLSSGYQFCNRCILTTQWHVSALRYSNYVPEADAYNIYRKENAGRLSCRNS